MPKIAANAPYTYKWGHH